MHISHLSFFLDTEPPVIGNVSSNIEQNTDPGRGYATVTWTPPDISDNSDVITITASHDPGDTFSVGVTEVSYVVVDEAGNMANATFYVNVTG